MKSNHSWAAHSLGLGQGWTNCTDLDDVTCILGARAPEQRSQKSDWATREKSWKKKQFIHKFRSNKTYAP